MTTRKHIAVIGAAGKMGKGIGELLLGHLAWLEIQEKKDVGTGEYRLYLIDSNEDELFQLRRFLRPLFIRFAEKKINALREIYSDQSDLVSNKEMIETFVERGLDLLHLRTSLDTDVDIVIEAASENLELKVALLKQARETCSEETYFYTNTSSIPINWLAKKTNLFGRLMGLHFYNPPPKQQVMEWVAPKDLDSGCKEFGLQLGKSLKKTMIESADVAGFIGNGLMMPEIQYICSRAKELAKERPYFEAIALLDSVTRVVLLRPMGMFQLIDFVGLDVCDAIATVMEEHLNESFRAPLLAEMLEKGRKGGQDLLGHPQDGFFHYEKGKIASIYLLDKEGEQPLPPVESSSIVPSGDYRLYFEEIKKSEEPFAKEAMRFLKNSKKIAEKLLQDKVISSEEDLKEILTKGFHHRYSPLEVI